VRSGPAHDLERGLGEPQRAGCPDGPDLSTPPEGFTGGFPPIRVAADSVSRYPWPGSAKPRFSSHMGLSQENGT
jgi:hypothetical protein